MSTPNTIVIDGLDPTGLKAAMQADFESPRDCRDQTEDGTDALSVSNANGAGEPFRTTVSSILDAGQFPMATVSDAEVLFTTVSSIEEDLEAGLRTDTVSGRRQVDLDPSDGTL